MHSIKRRVCWITFNSQISLRIFKSIRKTLLCSSKNVPTAVSFMAPFEATFRSGKLNLPTNTKIKNLKQALALHSINLVCLLNLESVICISGFWATYKYEVSVFRNPNSLHRILVSPVGIKKLLIHRPVPTAVKQKINSHKSLLRTTAIITITRDGKDKQRRMTKTMWLGGLFP